MIDCHCHLLEKEFDENREEIIEKCRKEMKAIINCCAFFPFEEAIKLVERYKGFIFASLAIHPIYVDKIDEEDIERVLKFIEENSEKICAIGETGLDYFHVKDEKLREKQKEVFSIFIKKAIKLKKPLLIHCRNAFEDCLEILREYKAKAVMWHLFSSRKHLKDVIEEGWFISVGPGIKKSKDIAKIVRDTQLNRIMLETDSPWFAQPNQAYGLPTNVKIVAEKISQIKKISYEEVERQTDFNAINFFNLKINEEKEDR
jgi:TatD DNase family protein